MPREHSARTTSGLPRQNSVRSGVTIVIPAHNEEQGIEDGIGAVERALRSSGWEYEIIVVDDGSTDATGERAGKRGVNVLRLHSNGGYGVAFKGRKAPPPIDLGGIIGA